MIEPANSRRNMVLTWFILRVLPKNPNNLVRRVNLSGSVALDRYLLFPARISHALLLIFLSPGLSSFASQEMDVILMMRPEGDAFKKASEGFSEELKNDFKIVDITIPVETTYQEFENHIKQNQPRAFVLLGTRVLKLYKTYQEMYPDKKTFPPAVALMVLYAEEQIVGIKNATCLTYDPPGIPALIGLRSVIKAPIRKVGVLYHHLTEKYFQENRKRSLQEEIELIGIKIDLNESREVKRLKEQKKLLGANGKLNRKDARTLRDAIKREARLVTIALGRLIDRERVDAIWILNDNKIVTTELVNQAWLPKLSEFHKPVIVGVPNLLRSGVVGNYATIPDHYALGKDAAEMMLEIREHGWSVEKVPPRDPVTVLHYINYKVLKNYYRFNEEILEQEYDYIIR